MSPEAVIGSDKTEQARQDTTHGSSRVDRRHRSKLERALRRMIEADPSPQVPQALWVSGPAGCGRATLIREIRAQQIREGVRWVSGCAYPGTGEILEPILRGVRDLIEELKSLAKMDSKWSTIWDQIVERRAPALIRVLPEAPWGRPIESFPELEPRFERSRLLDHLAGLILDYADHAPLVLQIDGAENHDGLSRDALEVLVRIIRTRRNGRVVGLPLPPPPPLGLVLVSGECKNPPIETFEGELLEVGVRGLERREFVRLIESKFGAEQPLSVTEKLFRLTKGNRVDIESRLSWEKQDGLGGTPEERARRLLEYGHFDQEVTRRFRCCSDEERQLLQILAVLGKPVSISILKRISSQPNLDTKSILSDLQEASWVQCDYGTTVQLEHERLRSPITETLNEDQRRDIHCRTSAAIAEEYEGRENRRFQEVYYHRARGPKGVAALAAAFDGAEEALRLYDFDGAIAIYRDLIQLLSHSEPQQLERGVASIAGVLGEIENPDEQLLLSLQKLLEKSESHLPPPVRAKLWRLLGQVAGRWGFVTRELDLIQRGYRTLSGYGRTQERVKVFAALARAFLKQQKFDETVQYCQHGLDLISMEELSSDPEFLELCHVTEQVHYRRREYVEAYDFEERFLKIATLQGSPIQQVESLLRLADLHEKQGEHESARTRLLESIPLARSSGSRLLEAKTQERIGSTYAKDEAWQKASEAFQSAFRIQSEIGDERRTIHLLGCIGLTSLALGAHAEGAHAFRLYAMQQECHGMLEVPPPVPGFPFEYRNRSERDEEICRHWRVVESREATPAERCRSLLALGDLHRDRGELQLARRSLSDGLRIASQHNFEPSRFHLRLGRLHRLCGNTGLALESLQSGIEAMSPDPERGRIAETLIQVGLLNSDRGDYDRAVNYLLRGLWAYLELEHVSGVAHALVEFSRLLTTVGQDASAEGMARAATTICATFELHRLEGEAWLAIGAARKRLKAGLDSLKAAEEIFMRLGVLEARARVLYQEAESRQSSGDAVGSRALCGEAIEISRDLGLEYWLAHGLAIRGELEGERPHRFLTAVRNLESSLQFASRAGCSALEVKCRRAMAELYRQRGSAALSREHEELANSIQSKLEEKNPYRIVKSSAEIGETRKEVVEN